MLLVWLYPSYTIPVTVLLSTICSTIMPCLYLLQVLYLLSCTGCNGTACIIVLRCLVFILYHTVIIFTCIWLQWQRFPLSRNFGNNNKIYCRYFCRCFLLCRTCKKKQTKKRTPIRRYKKITDTIHPTINKDAYWGHYIARFIKPLCWILNCDWSVTGF